ncbi:MAG TPA: acylneuraminate cytidylyltransferase [Candidatus Acidoferrales bacterium]|nr:acylneuraminate cytidylyltransferase [Candidatus Acidoferrales bacterium]
MAIIPARGGSKGIPGKNVRLLCGRPLLAYSIAAALAARSVDRVVVSTDDAEVARIAEQRGAQVVWRPAELCGDAVPSEPAILHALTQLKNTAGYARPVTAFLQCTSPLTAAAEIDGTVEELLKTDSDCALTVAPFPYFLWRTDGGCAAGVNHDPARRPMRQELGSQYVETGAVYAMRTEGFLRAGHRFFGRVALHVTHGPHVEIDEAADLETAAALLQSRESKARRSLLPQAIAAVVLDFDGVVTDNLVCVSENGAESVQCSRSDGYALAALRKRGIPCLVLSAETSPVVKARCDKLGIPCAQAVPDKLAWMKEWCRRQEIDLSRIIYVGNDEADADCLRAAGAGVAVADAHASARAAATLVLTARGGHGAVRELCDLILDGEGGDTR